MKDVFPERFRAARKAAGLTLDDVADVCRNKDGQAASRAAIAQWEVGKKRSRPNFDNLVAAARRIGVSIDWLVGLTDNNDPSSPGESTLARGFKEANPRDRHIIRQLLNLDPSLKTADEKKVAQHLKPVRQKQKRRST